MSKLKTLTKIAAATTFIGLGAWGIKYATAPAYDGSAGITYSKAFAPARDEDVDFHIWYPATPGGRRVTIGGNEL